MHKGKVFVTKLSFEKFNLVFCTAKRLVCFEPIKAAKFLKKFQVHSVLYGRGHPRRPRGSQSCREKGRDESFQVRAKERALSSVLENFRRAFSPDPTDCPWVSEDVVGESTS